MKLYLEKDSGEKIEVKEIDTLNSECEILFFHLKHNVNSEDMDKMGSLLTAKTGRKSIVLGPIFSEKIQGI